MSCFGDVFLHTSFTKHCDYIMIITFWLTYPDQFVTQRTVAQNAISPFPSFIRFSRCFCSPHGTIQRMLGSYSLTISIRSPCLRFSHHNVTLAQLFRFPNNILARHMVDSYSLGEFPRLSLFQRSVCYRDSLTISAMRTP